MTRSIKYQALNVMPAEAVELRFDNPTVDGGTLAYDGNGGAMVGANIIFQNVIPTTTPLNSGVTLTCNPNCFGEPITGVCMKTQLTRVISLVNPKRVFIFLKRAGQYY